MSYWDLLVSCKLASASWLQPPFVSRCPTSGLLVYLGYPGLGSFSNFAPLWASSAGARVALPMLLVMQAHYSSRLPS